MGEIADFMTDIVRPPFPSFDALNDAAGTYLDRVRGRDDLSFLRLESGGVMPRVLMSL